MIAAGLSAAAAGAAAFWAARAAVGAFHPRSEWFGPVFSRAPALAPADDRIALTFDDGPHEQATPRVLDILARHDVRATFFVIGRFVDAHADLVRRIIAEGHLVGNHTYDHHRAGLFYWHRYWRDQLERTEQAIARATADDPLLPGTPASSRPQTASAARLFRPPMGFKSRFNLHAAAALGLTTVTWSRRARDGVATDAAAIVRRVAAARPGDIVLLHDGVEPASRRSPEALIEALPDILASLAGRGLRPVRLDDLLGLAPAR